MRQKAELSLAAILTQSTSSDWLPESLGTVPVLVTSVSTLQFRKAQPALLPPAPRLGLFSLTPSPQLPLHGPGTTSVSCFCPRCARAQNHTHAHTHTQCQKQCTLARASLTQRAPSWELGQLLPKGRAICSSRPLPGVPRGLQQGPLSCRAAVSRWTFTKRPPLESVPLERAQGLGGLGREAKAAPQRAREDLPLGPPASPLPLSSSLPRPPGLLASSHLLPALRESKQHSGPGRAGSGPG